MTSARPLRLGTRGSALALWQARTVAGLLETAGTPVELVVIRTAGDRLQHAPLSAAGGKRLFVKEIEDALLRGEVDLAVHSAKDMPAELPEGLEVAAVLPREDPRDALALPAGGPSGNFATALARLGPAPVLGTGSVRRIAQLAALIPGATFAPIRGNVDTRIRKLDEGGFHALVLAAAGLRRLGFESRISAPIPVDHCVPAPGQGIVAIEVRSGDGVTHGTLTSINDAAAFASLDAERAVVTALGGGCHLPLGALSSHGRGRLEIDALVAAPDGSRVIRRQLGGPVSDPRGLGLRVADALIAAGAGPILDAARRAEAEGPYQTDSWLP